MPIRIQPIQNQQEAEAVFRLRYEVYVEELGRVQRYADHARRMIEEPLDRDSLLLAAYDGASIAGTLRVNYAQRCDLGEYTALYRMHEIGIEHPRATSITTKLLVAPAYRNSPLAYRLAVAAYRQAIRDGVLFDFIDVYPARVAFFERLGYRVHVPRAFHEEYGEVTVMCVNTQDRAHFERVGSPFLRYLRHEQHAA